MIGDHHGNIILSDGFSVLIALLFGKILNKDFCKLALLTPVLCEAKSSIVVAFLDANLHGFSSWEESCALSW